MWDFAMRQAAVQTPVMREAAGMAEPRMAMTEVRVMVESRAVRDVPVMVMHHIVMVPIGSPVVPAPAKATEDANANSQAKGNPWAIDIEAGHSNPCWVVWKGFPVHDPRIVFRYVNNFRICRLNRDRLAVRRDSFLLGALEVPSLLRPLTHHLNRIHYILLLVHVRVAEG